MMMDEGDKMAEEKCRALVNSGGGGEQGKERSLGGWAL